METTLFGVMIALIGGCVAVAFYMDWLGLWVSKEEMKEEIERPERTRALRQQAEAKGIGAGTNAAQAAGGGNLGARHRV